MYLEKNYSGKRVFITGHTGFKGSWMCMMLNELGADVYGYSLNINTSPALFDIVSVKNDIHSTIGDIRDFQSLENAYNEANPDIVIHLAAQPIVRDSYKNPKYTYETNVMGTVNILECLRKNPRPISFLNVTTDKVYENNDIKNHSFKENEKLDGYDPYSNSKSCSELVTHSYTKSFFSEKSLIAVSTARAGNVIGGGDFANDRIIPDCVRATINGKEIVVRNPYSIRPYQHVLEPLALYLLIAMKQSEDKKYSGYYNIGPRDSDCVTTGVLADKFVKYWGENAKWTNLAETNAPHEANYLRLDCKKVREIFSWEPIWDFDASIRKTVEWYKAWNDGMDMKKYTRNQISNFLERFESSIC